MKLFQPFVYHLLQGLSILAVTLVHLVLQPTLHLVDVLEEECVATPLSGAGVVFPRGEESPPTHLAHCATHIGAQLTGVLTAGTVAVKVPVVPDLRPPRDVAQHGSHVLDGDLLPGLDVSLGHQLECPVPQDVELGVTDAAV